MEIPTLLTVKWPKSEAFKIPKNGRLCKRVMA